MDAQHIKPTTHRQILRLHHVMERTGMRRSFIYREAAAGRFPAPRRIGLRASGWDAAAVDAWIRDRLAGAPIVKAEVCQ